MKTILSILCGLAFALGCVAAGPAEAADFYKGKTITIIVSYAPGGGYDLYSRLLSRHFSDHIPGHPAVVVQNMPGAGGVLAANHVYNIAPKDGTFIAAVNQNMPMFQLLGGKGVQYDAAKFNWIGVMMASNSLAMTWHTSGIKTLEDAKKREVTMAGNGVADDGNVYPRILNALLGTKFKVINGYTGTSDSNGAVERGEVDGMSRAGFYSFAAQKPDWLKEKKVNFLVQFGFEKQPELPDVPLMLDLVHTDEARQITTVVTLPTAVGYGHWLAPGVPAESVKILRAAYAETVKDKALLDDAKKAQMVIRPKRGEEIEAVIKNAAKTPKAILKKTADILEW
jgi:tripartite-type tricarboxylate transporter receptor subunit TctC